MVVHRIGQPVHYVARNGLIADSLHRRSRGWGAELQDQDETVAICNVSVGLQDFQFGHDAFCESRRACEKTPHMTSTFSQSQPTPIFDIAMERDFLGFAPDPALSAVPSADAFSKWLDANEDTGGNSIVCGNAFGCHQSDID
jgi:hypothetical protein